METQPWSAEIEDDYEKVLSLLRAGGVLHEDETVLPINQYALEARIAEKAFGMPRDLLDSAIRAHRLVDLAILSRVSENYDQAMTYLHRFAKTASEIDIQIDTETQRLLEALTRQQKTAPARSAAAEKLADVARRRDAEIVKRGLELIQQGKNHQNITTIILRDMELAPKRFGLEKAVSETTVRKVLQKHGIIPKQIP